MAINPQTYETSYAVAPMKKWGFGDESNTSALYGLETNVTQSWDHVFAKGAAWWYLGNENDYAGGYNDDLMLDRK